MEAYIRPKSAYQKDDCLFCGEKAVNEACFAKGRASVAIRCCDKDGCKQAAKKMAVKHTELFS